MNPEPWLNTTDYTWIELAFFAGGCYMWVAVYVIYIIEIRRKKSIEMPVFAACGDIGWEFAWSWLHRTNMGLLLVIAYRLWFILDLYIFWGLLRYGRWQLATPALKRPFVPLCIAAAVGWAVATHLFVKSGLDTPIGANSAYIAQMGISILYVILLLRQSSVALFSWPVAWLKMLGTGTNTIFMCIHPGYDDNTFLRFLAVTATTIDCVYIWIFWRKRRSARGLAPAAALAA
jgi:hypothetical protein